MRQTPDVILVGEMRDAETMATAQRSSTFRSSLSWTSAPAKEAFFRPLRGLRRLLTSPTACAVGYSLAP
jgi:type IV secretory pathway ATPase VirB11/archaellum biosynthesis ATPase